MSNIKYIIGLIVGQIVASVTIYIILYVINAYGFFCIPSVTLDLFIKISISGVLGAVIGLLITSIYEYYKHCKSNNTDDKDDKNKY